MARPRSQAMLTMVPLEGGAAVNRALEEEVVGLSEVVLRSDSNGRDRCVMYLCLCLYICKLDDAYAGLA